eukprot:30894-Pelagococcus_subviridis.AAC.12
MRPAFASRGRRGRVAKTRSRARARRERARNDAARATDDDVVDVALVVVRCSCRNEISLRARFARGATSRRAGIAPRTARSLDRDRVHPERRARTREGLLARASARRFRGETCTG